MKRALWILGLGLFACIAGSLITFWMRTSPYQEVWHHAFPELEWLKREFEISPARFQRLEQTHHDHMNHCDEMCRRAVEVNAELMNLVGGSREMTPAIAAKMAESEAIRLECRKLLLTYFFKVSEEMNAAQGLRFLQWATAETLFTPEAVRHHGGLGGHH